MLNRGPPLNGDVGLDTEKIRKYVKYMTCGHFNVINLKDNLLRLFFSASLKSNNFCQINGRLKSGRRWLLGHPSLQNGTYRPGKPLFDQQLNGSSRALRVNLSRTSSPFFSSIPAAPAFFLTCRHASRSRLG